MVDLIPVAIDNHTNARGIFDFERCINSNFCFFSLCLNYRRFFASRRSKISGANRH